MQSLREAAPSAKIEKAEHHHIGCGSAIQGRVNAHQFLDTQIDHRDPNLR